MMPTHLSCPVCRAALNASDNNLRCENGHSFDRARQGYWNLLLAHKKRSKNPGDSAEMVQARRAFLNEGHYLPLSERVNALAATQCDPAQVSNIVDMGCGEGFYTERLFSSLSEQQLPLQLTGLDISKPAVRAACQRSKEIHWLVASGADMPLPQGSVDLLLVMFSRLMPQPFADLVKPGGYLLLAWPGDNHLIELRQQIYQEVRSSGFDPASQLDGLFSVEKVEQVSYPFTLDNRDSIATLLEMTPHARRLNAEAREQLLQQAELSLTLDVNLGLFRRL